MDRREFIIACLAVAAASLIGGKVNEKTGESDDEPPH
jgi:hypothetical protein